MNIIVWLIAGGLIGWVASAVMVLDAHQEIAMNVVVGVVGAFVAGGMVSPLFGVATIDQVNFSVPALVVSFLGASILLAIVNVSRGSGAR